MLHRLRQVAFLVNDLEQAAGLYRSSLGMRAGHTGDLPEYGLRNKVLPAGKGTYLELLQPTDATSPAGRYRQRRGESPYLMALQTTRYDELIPHLKSLGVRITAETKRPGYRSAFVHPASANGAFLELVELVDPEGPWPGADDAGAARQSPPLTMQLRQVAVLVRDLDQATEQWSRMFGIRTTRRFQVSFTNLEIAVMPLEGMDTFIELAQPTADDTASARFLQRYGEGIYLTIFQIEDSLAMDAHLQTTGLQFTSSRVTPNYTNMGFNSIWLHPRTMRGAFIQLSQVFDPENPWPPAGDDWYPA